MRRWSDMAEFPDVERFEVYAKAHDGTLSPHARGMAYYLSNAEALAQEWTDEAAERHRLESKGPVKPEPPAVYVVVRVIEKREVV